jgi:hypothetical protein
MDRFAIRLSSRYGRFCRGRSRFDQAHRTRRDWQAADALSIRNIMQHTDAMPDFALDFTWYRDPKGYRLMPARPVRRRPGQSILDTRVGDIQPARIVRNGGALQSYRPLDKFPNLFRYFIGIPKSENGALEFVERFGPLTYDGLQRDGDVVPAMIDHAEDMSQVLRGRIVAIPLNKLNASIVTDQSGMRLKVSPACLLDALWLQLAQAKSGGSAGFRECLQCRNLFMVGVGADRRADAKFCSDKCRIEFNNLKRSR